MKFKRIMLVSVLLLAVLTIGAVSASEDISEDLAVDGDAPTQDSLELSVDDVTGDGESQKSSDYYNVTEVKNEILAGEGEQIRFDVEYGSDGAKSIYVDDNEVASNDGGELTLDVDELGLSFGPHIAKFSYAGNDQYVGFEREIGFNYSYFRCIISENPTTDDSIGVELANGASGKVKISIDGKVKYDQEYDFGSSVYLDDLSFGTHTYEVIYYGDSQHKKVTKSGKFNLTYAFEVYNPDEMSMGEGLTVSIYLPNDANTDAVVTANGKSYNVEIVKGYGVCYLYDFTLGDNVISVKYKDSKYPERTLNSTVYVKSYFSVPAEPQYKNGDNITLILPADAKGTFTAKIANNTYIKELVNGCAVISLDDLDVGTYPVEFSYTGDFKDSVELDYSSITVKPKFSVPKAMFVNGSYSIEFSAPESFEGTLRVYGDLFNATAEVKNGKATIPLKTLKPGEYDLNMEFTSADDSEYYEYTKYVKVYQSSPDLDFDVQFSKTINKLATSGEGPSLSVHDIPGDFEGPLTVYLDGRRYGTISADENYMEINDVFNLPVGQHNITVAYEGSNYFKQVSKTVSFEVGYVTIYIPPVIMMPHDSEIAVSVPDNATGIITVNVDGKKFTSEKLSRDYEMDGVYYRYFDLSKLNYGNHEIEVIYDGNYGKITKKASAGMDYEIDLSSVRYQYNYGQENSFLFTLPSALTGNVEVFIDGKKYNTAYDKEMDEYSVNISDVSLGVHNVSVRYLGDTKFPAKTFTENLIIDPIIDYPYKVRYNEDGYVSLVLPKDAAGTLTLVVSDYYGENSKIYRTNMSNGVAKIKLPNTVIGQYSIRAFFEGNYEVDEMSYNYEVVPAVTAPSEMKWGENKNITIMFSPDVTGTVTVYLNENQYSELEIINGKATMSLSKLPIGYNDIMFSYSQGDFYWDEDVYIDVIGYTPKLVGGKDITMYYGDSKTYSLKVWGVYGKVVGAGEIVNIKIGKTTYKAKTNKKGIASVKITSLPGKYTITATYKGVKVTNKLTVKRVISFKAVTVKKSAKKLVLTATLKKGKTPLKNKKVTFKFNGKTYTAKTNKKGVAKVTVKKAVLKKLKVGKKITYQATYLKDTVKKSVNVKK